MALSKDLMGIHLPGRGRDAHVALVVELDVQLLVVGVFVGNDCLVVASCYLVAIREPPESLSVGLIVSEGALIDGAVRELPLPFHYLVIGPFTAQFRIGVLIGVNAGAVFFAEHPPAHVDILISVCVSPLSVFYAVLPLPCLDLNVP